MAEPFKGLGCPVTAEEHVNRWFLLKQLAVMSSFNLGVAYLQDCCPPTRRAAAAGCPEVRAGLPASRFGALCSCCAVLAFLSLDHKARKLVSKVSAKEGPFAVGVVPRLVSPAG